MALPDFFIIGAMKCGTSTLQAQLAAQNGIFMCEPKEPNFFSDDANYAKGLGWYEALFAAAAPGDLKGEASTHYAKLPTHPDCVERLAAAVPDPKIVYMLREPKARLVSHYMHKWTMGEIDEPLADAIRVHPEFVAYSRYGMQIAPYVERFGKDRILLSSAERLAAAPEAELARVAAFVGFGRASIWREDRARENISAERVRRFPFYDLLIDHPVAAGLRRAVVPKTARRALRQQLQMRRRPELTADLRRELDAVFAEDRAALIARLPEAADILAPPTRG